MKKTLALLLAAMMLLSLLAGCASEPADNTPSDTPADATAPATEPTDEPPADEPSEEPVDEPAEAPASGVELPLADELTTITMWRGWSGPQAQSGINNPNESRGYQVAEELTNVHVDWELASDAMTQFPLMLASGDYPDAFQGAGYTTGSPSKLDNYVDEEIILDLTDLITELAPNYQAARTADEDITRRTTTDDRRLLAFYNIKDTVQPSWLGYVGRQDWLEAFGEEPRTYDDYHELLTMYRDSYGCPIPTGFTATGLDNFWMAGFDVGPSWIVVDDKVEHSVTQPGFKDYLTLMNQWYSEGLIDPEFYSRTTGLSFEYVMCCDGSVGLFQTAYTWIKLTQTFSEDPDFTLVGIQPAVKELGDTRKIMVSSDYHRLEGSYACLFATCENPELVARYFDFFFTPEGSRLVDFGIENESYTLDENGNPQFMDHILNPADPGMTPSIAWIPYTADGMPRLYVWERELATGLPENAEEATHIWDANWEDSISFPAVSLTAEESEDYSAIMNDIETRISETIVKFIIGTEPMENFDSFVETLVGMGLPEAQTIQQTAYDRFMAR